MIPITYYKNTSLEKAIDRLFVEADRAYREGANILILSDRGVDEIPCADSITACSVRPAAASGQDKEENCSCHDLESPANRERYIILQHCWAMVPVRSTHIWHRIP